MAEQIQVHEGEEGGVVRHEGVAIRPGIYVPGLGQVAGLRVRMTEAFLQKLAPTFKGGYVNLDHRRDSEYEVGKIEDAWYAAGGVRLRIALHEDRPRFAEAQGFIAGRQAQGQVPNFSIEVDEDQYIFNMDPGGEWDAEIVEGRGTGVAILPVGACSDKEGCGVGLGRRNGILMLAAYEGNNISVNDSPGRASGDGEGESEQEGNHMADEEKNGGQGSPAPAGAHKCGCGGAGGLSLEAVRTEARNEVKSELETTNKRVKELEEQLESETKARTAAEEKVQAFQEAEHTATMEALAKEAETAGVEVKEIVGEEPSTEQALVALRALQMTAAKQASRLGMRGRSTVANPKGAAGAGSEPSAEQLKQKHYEAAQVRLGLRKAKGVGALPPALAKNRPWLSEGKAPATPEDGDA